MREGPSKRPTQPEHPGIDEDPTQGPGDAAEQFEAIFEREHDRLYRALYLLTGRSHEAEELMQDAFVRVWERWRQRGSPDDPVGYLYRTAMNTFRMGYRRQQVSLRNLVHPGPPRDQFEEIDIDVDVRAAMSILTRRQREAIVLTAFLGCEPAEAATLLGIRPSTLRALTTQARAAMRERIGEP